MPAGCTWQRENPSLLSVCLLMLVLKDSPPNFKSMLPSSAAERLFRRSRHTRIQCSLRFNQDGDLWSVIVWFWWFWLRFRKGQKTPLVACLPTRAPSQAASVSRVTDLFRAVRASDWLQASVLTKGGCQPDLGASLPDDLQHLLLVASLFYE